MVKYTTDLKGQKDRPNDVCDKFIQGIGVDIPEEIVLNSVFITEQPIYLQNVKTTFSIANVIYSFERELWNLNIDYWPVDVGHWKSSVLGNGKADKSDIRNFCTIKWGDRFSEQDWADAACLGLYGVQKFGKGK